MDGLCSLGWPVLIWHKGDEARPKCRRCYTRNLTCTRPAKKTVFRNASTAPFNNDQRWVSGEIKECEFQPVSGLLLSNQDLPPAVCVDARGAQADLSLSSGAILGPSARSEEAAHSEASSLQNNSLFDTIAQRPSLDAQDAARSPHGYRHRPWQGASADSPSSTTRSDLSTRNPDLSSQPYGQAHDRIDESSLSPNTHFPRLRTGESAVFPLQDPQEACLLRYFVEELSHWVCKRTIFIN